LKEHRVFDTRLTSTRRALRAVGVLGIAAISWLVGAYTWIHRSPGDEQDGAMIAAFATFTLLCVALFYRSGIGPGSVVAMSLLGFAFGSLFVPQVSMSKRQRIAEIAGAPMARYGVQYPILIASVLIMARLGFQRMKDQRGESSADDDAR
jgi:hypothetical protein